MSRASKQVYHPHGDADDFQTVEDTLDSLDDRVTQNETDIATAQSDISDLEARSNFTEASESDYQGNASGLKALTPETVWTSTGYTALTDAATITVNMAGGFNFSVTIGASRTLGNPSNAKTGQSGVFKITASGATRTISLGSNYLITTDLSFPVSIASGQIAYLSYFVDTSTRILITAVLNNPS